MMTSTSMATEASSEATWKPRGVGRSAIQVGASASERVLLATNDTCTQGDGTSKAFHLRASLVSAVRRCLFHAQLFGMECRRAQDAVSVMALLLALAASQWYTTEVLLQPPGTVFARIAFVVFQMVHALFCLSWLGIVYQGPGRVYPQEQSAPLPSAMAGALRLGQFCEQLPFSDERRWCTPCACWKPALAHHCSTCGRCSLWMHHHCRFAATCIGFRNLRCFLQCLGVGQALVALLIVFVIQSLVNSPPQSGWQCLQMVGFIAVLICYGRLSQMSLRSAMKHMASGWPSGVLMRKYEVLMEEVEEMQSHFLDLLNVLIEKEDDSAISNDAITSAFEELQSAKAAVHCARGLIGHFGCGTLAGNFIPIFGSPVSLRWWIPMLPGGSGDPLAPTSYDEKACEAWVRLGAALERCQQVTKFREEAAAQWSNQISSLLSSTDSAVRD